MKGLITTEGGDAKALLQRLHEVPELEGRDLVSEVTRTRRQEWSEGYAERFMPSLPPGGDVVPHVVVMDYGAKRNIFRSLVEAGFRVTVLPAGATAAEVMSEKPDGVLLSNGPGDPRVLSQEIDTVRELLGNVPIFGICLGHQLLAAAMGADVYKLKFGHHGGNQPVQDLDTGKVEITSQNHGFAVDASSLPKEVAVERVNLNDQTVEGLRHRTKPVFCVQYHPEASPGPHDSTPLFAEFRRMIEES
jgi:carbamoyl-phosphate synthase small subunit